MTPWTGSSPRRTSLSPRGLCTRSRMTPWLQFDKRDASWDTLTRPTRVNDEADESDPDHASESDDDRVGNEKIHVTDATDEIWNGKERDEGEDVMEREHEEERGTEIHLQAFLMMIEDIDNLLGRREIESLLGKKEEDLDLETDTEIDLESDTGIGHEKKGLEIVRERDYDPEEIEIETGTETGTGTETETMCSPVVGPVVGPVFVPVLAPKDLYGIDLDHVTLIVTETTGRDRESVTVAGVKEVILVMRLAMDDLC